MNKSKRRKASRRNDRLRLMMTGLRKEDCMKYTISFEKDATINNGKKYLCIHGVFVTSSELAKIQEKIGDSSKYKIGKRYTIIV